MFIFFSVSPVLHLMRASGSNRYISVPGTNLTRPDPGSREVEKNNVIEGISNRNNRKALQKKHQSKHSLSDLPLNLLPIVFLLARPSLPLLDLSTLRKQKLSLITITIHSLERNQLSIFCLSPNSFRNFLTSLNDFSSQVQDVTSALSFHLF